MTLTEQSDPLGYSNPYQRLLRRFGPDGIYWLKGQWQDRETDSYSLTGAIGREFGYGSLESYRRECMVEEMCRTLKLSTTGDPVMRSHRLARWNDEDERRWIDVQMLLEKLAGEYERKQPGW